MEITGKLRDYQRHTFRDGEIVFYTGRIYDDVKGRFYDGCPIRTSMVVSEDGDIVTTLNSIYQLVTGE